MLKQIWLTSALVAAFGALAASAAVAAMPSPAVTVAPFGAVTPVAYKPKHRYGVHGIVRPRQEPLLKPGTILSTPNYRLLYNLPEPYNPIEPPYDDPIRQSYPGLGLYR